MTEASSRPLRERFETVDLGALVVLFAVVTVAADGVLESMASVLVVLFTIPVVQWALETADVGETAAKVLLGAIVAAGGIVVFVDGSTWVGAGVVAVGCWIVLDAVDEIRHGTTASDTPDEDVTEAEVSLLMSNSRWVVEELREASRPLTAGELRERTGLTPAELEDVLEIALDNGTVDRVGNGYVVDERELGGVAFVRGLVRSVGGRVLRPFRLIRPSE